MSTSSFLALLLLPVVLLTAFAMEFEIWVLHRVVEILWDETHHVMFAAPFVQRKNPRVFTAFGARLSIALYAHLLSIIPSCAKIAPISHIWL